MLASSSQFTAMIDGQDVICDVRVTLTLPAGPYSDVTLAVESLRITAQITTDMPSGSRLDVGYPKIDADITLSGMVDPTDETKTAAWLFGPWGPLASDGTVSPLYRQPVLNSPVTIDIGLNPTGSAGTAELLRKFTGYIDEISVSEDGTVSLSCLDNHTKLRALPTIAAAIIAPPMNNGLTSEFALDDIVYRASGGTIGTRPKTRPSCILNVGLRTSLFPDVGYQYGANLSPVFKPGAFGSALCDETTAGLVGFTTTTPAASTFFFEYWVTTVSSPPQPVVGVGDGLNNTLGVRLTGTGLQIFAPGNSTSTPDFTWTLSTFGTRYVGVKWTQTPGSTAWSATLYLDAASTTTSGVSPAARGATWSTAFVTLQGTGQVQTVEAFQVTNETAPVVSYPFTPNAVLDPSLNALQAVPAYSGDPWSIIQQIADAELGVAGFDESGVFRFYNRNTLRTGAVVRTLTSATSLMNASSSLSASELINRVQVVSQPWSFQTGALAWNATSAQKIPKLSTQTITVDLGDVLVGQIVQQNALTLSDGHTFSDGLSYFRASTSKGGAREAPLSAGAVFIQQTDSSHLQITVKNPYSYDIWLVSPANYLDMAAGTPSLWVGGTLATQASGNTADVQWPPINPDGTGGAASTQPGEVGHEISGNQWVQDDPTALQLATDILTDMSVVRPSLNEIEIVPDPRLQLVDRVIVQDPDVTNVSEHALLFGWELDWSADAELSMKIDARTIAYPGNWILGVTGRSELSTTTLI